MIVMNVTYKCKPNMREAYLERLRAEGVGEGSRADEGNIKYDYYRSVDDENELFLLEKWEHEEGLKKHAEQPHFKRLMEFKSEYVLETVFERYEAQ